MSPRWKTRDGREVFVDEMEASHIRYAMAMIEDGRMNPRRVVDQRDMPTWLLVFRAELTRRGLK